MTPAKPSLDLLRALTNEHVLRALMIEPRLTRAELAARTGISKPTASESVRRLTEAGLIHDTGARTTGRGRVGSYYALAEDIGTALVVSIAPDGVVTENVDCHGAVRARVQQLLVPPAEPAVVTAAIRATAGRARDAVAGPVRLAVVSAADPVDRGSGRLVRLPDAPFLVGELNPAEVLRPVVAGPILVDNDVNWEARAERAAYSDDLADLDDFAYLHLGAGLGCAVVSDGEVRRGFSGMAGEIAHLVTAGPRGRAMALIEVFGALDLRQPGATAIDVPALLAAVSGRGARAESVRTTIGAALRGVLAALVTLCDPEVVVLGGEWGAQPAVVAAIEAGFADSPRAVAIRPATVTDEPALSGARGQALDELRATIAALPREN